MYLQNPLWSGPATDQSLLSAISPQTFGSSHVQLQEISETCILNLISVLVYDWPKLETLPFEPNPTLILNHKNCYPSPTRIAKQSDSAFILQMCAVPSNNLTLTLMVLSLLRRVNSLKSSEKSRSPIWECKAESVPNILIPGVEPLPVGHSKREGKIECPITFSQARNYRLRF